MKEIRDGDQARVSVSWLQRVRPEEGEVELDAPVSISDLLIRNRVDSPGFFSTGFLSERKAIIYIRSSAEEVLMEFLYELRKELGADRFILDNLVRLKSGLWYKVVYYYED